MAPAPVFISHSLAALPRAALSPAIFQLPALPLQVEPVAGGPLAFLGTFLVSWALFTYAAQVAASFFLGDVPWRRAAVVGLVPAVVNVALVRQEVLLILALGVVADFVAVRVVYRVRYRTAALVTLLHAAVSVIFGVFIAYLLALLSTAPG